MIFLASNNGTQWILDFGHDSLVLSVKDLDEDLRISSLKIPMQLSVCCCLKDKKFYTIPCLESIQSLCQNDYQDDCLNGECYYLLKENIVGRNCIWFYGKNAVKIYVLDLGESFKVKYLFTESYAF